MKRTVVIPDLQCPYEDSHVVRNLSLFIKAFRPDAVLTIGDEIDLPQISRWTENTPGWYEQTLAEDRDRTVDVLWSLFEYSKEAHMVRSNHTDRLYKVIMKKIPAFLSLPELKFEKFLKLDEMGVKFWSTPMPIAKGWIAIHGDLGSLNPNPGLSALNQAKRHGQSVIMGHTHRAGRSAVSEASNGVLRRVLHGVEVGHAMDLKAAKYVSTPNWQQAFAIVTENGKNVQVDLIYIEKDGTFQVHGRRYGRAR
jgi:predicted phosphodiesterase